MRRFRHGLTLTKTPISSEPREPLICATQLCRSQLSALASVAALLKSPIADLRQARAWSKEDQWPACLGSVAQTLAKWGLYLTPGKPRAGTQNPRGEVDCGVDMGVICEAEGVEMNWGIGI